MTLTALVAVASIVFNYDSNQPQLNSGYGPAYPPAQLYVPPPATALPDKTLTAAQFTSGIALTRTTTNTLP